MDENACSTHIIGAAIEVHRALGSGLLESAYRLALTHELALRGLRVCSERPIGISYKALSIPQAFRVDLLVEDLVIVELKATQKLLPIHAAQLLTYLRFSGHRLGLLLNFHEQVLKRGIVRVANGL